MEEHSFWMRLADSAELHSETAAGQTVVELLSDCRVLIENHRGVLEYSRERIHIKTKFGAVAVCGNCLELTKMTRQQLIISGRIDGLSVMRRGKR